MTRDSGSFPVPARIHRVEEVVRRSRFVTTLARAPDAAAAHAFRDRIRGELPDATHHCWAFVAGPPGSTRSVGMSDAGEPHGTAGRPMLAALLHGGVGEVVAVCARWFGGTKLGTGGLSRAYASGVTKALQGLPTEVRTRRERLQITMSYPYVDAVQRLLEEFEAPIVEEEYGADVRYRAEIPALERASFEEKLANLTRGEAEVRSVQ